MIRSFALALCAAIALPLASTVQAAEAAPSEALKRHRIGYGHLIDNDLIGDGKDRWRTGSVASSRIYGYGWDGQAPANFGELLELRFLGQIIAPDNLRNPAAGDRPWAGALSLGLHTHMQRGSLEISLGGDLVFIGPQTGLDGFQDALHDLANTTRPSDAVRDAQIPNTIRPTFVGELGKTITLGPRSRLRPFVEARAGDETLVRIGADLTLGTAGQGELLVRDPVTGQRYRTMYDTRGLSFTLGGDVAHVAQSVYLPEGRGYALNSRRDRLRAGLHWQGDGRDFFYGITYLGKEFSGQDTGQIVGSLRLRWTF